MRVCLYGARRRLRFLFVAIWMAGCAVARPHVRAEPPQRPSAALQAGSPAREGMGLSGLSNRPQEASPMPCGRNGLYMLLRLLGRDVSYVEIQRNVPAGPHGTSLLELCDGALRSGVKLAVYRSDPANVDAVRNTPSLALLFERHRQKQENGAGTALLGHYVVMGTGCGDGGAGTVAVIDGEYGDRESFSDEQFASIWTGYCLAPARSSWASWWQVLSAAAACLLVFGACRICGRLTWPRSVWTADHRAILWVRRVIAALAICGSCECVYGDEKREAVNNEYDFRNGSWEAWRVPERDAVNALAVFSKVCGVECTYDDVVEAFGNPERKWHLLDIRDAGHRLGVRASVYRSTPAALGSLNVPVIAHIEGGNAEGGGFFIVLPTRNGSGWDVIDGSTMAIRTISTDQLLRTWDGYILKPDQESIRQRSAWAGAPRWYSFCPG